MMKRIALMTALLVAPLAMTPDDAAAQERGQQRATEASANAQANGRPTTLPPGMENRPPGMPLPPGLARTRPQEPGGEPAPDPDPEPQPDPDDCLPELVFDPVTGQWTVVPCEA